MRKIIGCCLIAVSLLACTACSGLDRLSENLREGAEQLGDDVVIGKSNALITPYQSFEGSRTSDNDAFLATYDASVTGFNVLVADTDLKENECREIVIRYQFDSLDGDCQLIYISPDLEEQVLSESASGSVAVQLQAGANYIGIIGTDYSGAIQIMTVALVVVAACMIRLGYKALLAEWAIEAITKAEKEFVGTKLGEARLAVVVSWLRAKVPAPLRFLVTDSLIQKVVQVTFNAAKAGLEALKDA